MIIDTKDYLEHHGVSGQKWGKRRYQNPDGTLTPEGYIHYGYHQKDGSVSVKNADKFLRDTKKSTLVNKTSKEDRERINSDISRLKELRKTDKVKYTSEVKKYMKSKHSSQAVKGNKKVKIILGVAGGVLVAGSAAAIATNVGGVRDKLKVAGSSVKNAGVSAAKATVRGAFKAGRAVTSGAAKNAVVNTANAAKNAVVNTAKNAGSSVKNAGVSAAKATVRGAFKAGRAVTSGAAKNAVVNTAKTVGSSVKNAGATAAKATVRGAINAGGNITKATLNATSRSNLPKVLTGSAIGATLGLGTRAVIDSVQKKKNNNK